MAFLLLIGCERVTSAPEVSVDGVPLSEIIQIRRLHSADTVLANTRSYDTLEARIPRDATSRVITFTTSVGFFELNNLKELKIRADRDTLIGTTHWAAARVVLRSDTLTIDAIVSAVIGDYRDTVHVPFKR